MAKANIADAQVIVLMELDGQVHMVAMDKDKMQMIDILVKSSIDTIVRTNVTHKQLVEILTKK